MARRGRDLAALAALMGAGALASRKGVDLGDVPEYTSEDRETFQTAYRKKGGYIKAADGCAQRGKTRGKMV
jgi:hypothetical protein